MWVVLTLLGFTVLVQQFPWIQQVLMLIGGLFLAKMGWGMLSGGWHSWQQRKQFDDTQVQIPAAKNYFLLGLFTNLSNPKTLIYFSSVFALALSSSASASLKSPIGSDYSNPNFCDIYTIYVATFYTKNEKVISAFRQLY